MVLNASALTPTPLRPGVFYLVSAIMLIHRLVWRRGQNNSSRPANALSFSHVDVGNAFQFINQRSVEVSLPFPDVGDVSVLRLYCVHRFVSRVINDFLTLHILFNMNALLMSEIVFTNGKEKKRLYLLT